MTNKFEIRMFDDEYICFPYKSIIVCNNNIKNAILNNQVKLEAPEPYVIITNNHLTDEQVNILEEASIADCLNYIKSRPVFGGLII